MILSAAVLIWIGGEERPKTYRQIRARISPLPVANSCPCGLGATEITMQDQLSEFKQFLSGRVGKEYVDMNKP